MAVCDFIHCINYHCFINEYFYSVKGQIQNGKSLLLHLFELESAIWYLRVIFFLLYHKLGISQPDSQLPPLVHMSILS